MNGRTSFRALKGGLFNVKAVPSSLKREGAHSSCSLKALKRGEIQALTGTRFALRNFSLALHVHPFLSVLPRDSGTFSQMEAVIWCQANMSSAQVS